MQTPMYMHTHTHAYTHVYAMYVLEITSIEMLHNKSIQTVTTHLLSIKRADWLK